VAAWTIEAGPTLLKQVAGLIFSNIETKATTFGGLEADAVRVIVALGEALIACSTEAAIASALADALAPLSSRREGLAA
jgi:hypothetical protein